MKPVCGRDAALEAPNPDRLVLERNVVEFDECCLSAPQPKSVDQVEEQPIPNVFGRNCQKEPFDLCLRDVGNGFCGGFSPAETVCFFTRSVMVSLFFILVISETEKGGGLLILCANGAGSYSASPSRSRCSRWRSAGRHRRPRLLPSSQPEAAIP